MGESYVDFGSIGMFIPIFLLGLIFGKMYAFFISRPRYILLAYGSLVAISRPMTEYGTSVIKVLGGSLMSFIIVALFFSFIAPLIHKWLSSDIKMTYISNVRKAPSKS